MQFFSFYAVVGHGTGSRINFSGLLQDTLFSLFHPPVAPCGSFIDIYIYPINNKIDEILDHSGLDSTLRYSVLRNNDKFCFCNILLFAKFSNNYSSHSNFRSDRSQIRSSFSHFHTVGNPQFNPNRINPSRSQNSGFCFHSALIVHYLTHYNYNC